MPEQDALDWDLNRSSNSLSSKRLQTIVSNLLPLKSRRMMFEQSIHTGVVIACCDAFCHTITKKTVVVVDNASIHRSEACEDRLPSWKQHGLISKSLSPYSPE